LLSLHGLALGAYGIIGVSPLANAYKRIDFMRRLSPLMFSLSGIACLAVALGQQMPPAVAGSGYSAPVPIFIAPGGLTTVYVQGIGTKLMQLVAANTVPLPTKLAGIAVTLKQTELPHGPIAVPLLAVFPVNICQSAVFAPCGTLTGINVQIPFELVPNPSTSDPFLSPTNYAQLVISEDGGGQATVEAVPLSDQIHVLRTGDTITNPGAANLDRPISTLNAVVTHADGTPVTPALRGTPAEPGETLILYAVGLGPVMPKVASGDATPATAPVAFAMIAFDFNFTGEVSPHFPTLSPVPLFSGLTPGFVGLYQVNFVVPQLPPNYRVHCNTELGNTNLTVSIGRITSFDGAKICVDVAAL
jgi:uncharacterized protein (TIGR03437 family)